VNNNSVTKPWGGKHPEIITGSKVGEGKFFWNMGFATLTLEGVHGMARYYQLEDYVTGTRDEQSQWKDATLVFEEHF